MLQETLLKSLQEKPIIAAVRSREEARAAMQAPVAAVFLLGGNLFDLREDVQAIQSQGQYAFVHLDLVDGVRKDADGVRLLAEMVGPKGVLTTKGGLVQAIHSHGMLAGLRCFLLDGQSYQMAVKTARSALPDFIELMPGLLPDILGRFRREVDCYLVAGGLVTTALHAQQAFAAGAHGISTSTRALWTL